MNYFKILATIRVNVKDVVRSTGVRTLADSVGTCAECGVWTGQGMRRGGLAPTRYFLRE
eukprot:SAG22_NODE_9314_length_596_cov_49.696177_2_plen_59_part_00